MPTLTNVNVTPKIAAHVLWHFQPGVAPALKPGSFTRSLIDTIARADPTNKARLALGFPEYVFAVDTYQNTLGAHVWLHDLAAGRGPSITCPNCDRESSHPEDVAQGYCGNCHQWTSPPYGAHDDQGQVQQLDTLHCERCDRNIPRVAWVYDDHAVVLTGNLQIDEGVDVPEGKAFPIHAPAWMVWCSQIDWTATRG